MSGQVRVVCMCPAVWFPFPFPFPIPLPFVHCPTHPSRLLPVNPLLPSPPGRLIIMDRDADMNSKYSNNDRDGISRARQPISEEKRCAFRPLASGPYVERDFRRRCMALEFGDIGVILTRP